MVTLRELKQLKQEIIEIKHGQPTWDLILNQLILCLSVNPLSVLIRVHFCITSTSNVFVARWEMPLVTIVMIHWIRWIQKKSFRENSIMYLVCSLKGSDLLVFRFIMTKTPLTVIKTSSLSASFRTVKEELPICTSRECSFIGNTIPALWLKIREIFIE